MNKKRGQHFLLSAKARTFSLMQIFRLSDDQAFQMFKEARWGDDEPVCPKCGGQHHYWLGTRKQWRCKDKDCKYTFSVTAGTNPNGEETKIITTQVLIANWYK